MDRLSRGIPRAGTVFLSGVLRRSVFARLVALAAMLAGAPAHAAILYWSGNGSSQGGNGTWDTTSVHFGSSSTGPYSTIWNNTTNAADTALFGGSTATATLGTNITVRGVTFNNASTVAGGGFSLTTGGASNLTVAAGGVGRGTGGTISAPIVGSGGLSISNTAGPIVLTGSSTYSGTTIIGAAVSGVPIRLNLGNGGATGSIGSSSGLRVDAGSVFATNRSGTITQGVNFPLINGGGEYIKNGVGTAIFTLTNGYSGATTVSAGSLEMGDGGTTGSLGASSSISVSNNAAFAVNRSNNVTQASSGGAFRAITGAGEFHQVGSGTTTLALANSYTGPTRVSGGALKITGTLAATAITVEPFAILGGTGTTAGDVTFEPDSMFLFDAAAPLNVGGSVTFSDPASFGVDDIIGLDSSVDEGTYTLIAGNVTTTNLANLGSSNAYDLGSGKSAYFQQGSLQVVVVPEPASLAATAAGAVAIAIALRRRRTYPVG
jgi:autotransporter-associated beta strand protein